MSKPKRQILIIEEEQEETDPNELVELEDNHDPNDYPNDIFGKRLDDYPKNIFK